MKKNTLLYLDENLVREAKKKGINISKLAENSIKSTLFPFSSIGEKAALDFGTYLKDLEKDNQVYFLPFKIKSLILENVGPIEKLHINFKEKNIIQGAGASGKTILLKAISHSFGRKDLSEDGIINNKRNFKVKLELVKELKIIETNFKKDYKCILIDGGMDRLEGEFLKKFISYLSKLDCQVILTSQMIKEKQLNKKFNIIKLENPRLKAMLKERVEDMMHKLMYVTRELKKKSSHKGDKEKKEGLEREKVKLEEDIKEIKLKC